jgi:hypothetical protein
MFHTLPVEAEVFMALENTDVTVPPTLGMQPTHEAMGARGSGPDLVLPHTGFR